MVAVTAIETGSPSAWNRQQVIAELQRDAGLSLVAVTENNSIVGWCCGFVVAGDGELLKIAVHSQHRRQGVARQLLVAFCKQLVRQGAQQLFLEVRSSNYAALQLYTENAFLETGRRRHYYSDPVDDAVILLCPLQNTKAVSTNNYWEQV